MAISSIEMACGIAAIIARRQGCCQRRAASAMSSPCHRGRLAARQKRGSLDHAPSLRPAAGAAACRQYRASRLFIGGNDQFFLNIAMAMGKAIMDPVNGIAFSTIVTAMSRNGTEFGIK
ncbi:MAG TPA: DUF1116 domain-containing protein, partial [Stellaceae bacterium]|nr:DUF1116 domain-containing protein [Stellaceae bacterium]